ncbi:sugar-binding domain-containing protein [Mariniblastus fucicola]|uniref:Beta-galactosidase n=1 Tax=Mariniblastus fucicola TaxID=980251 RepID=A0A5B9PAL0_9BACT|nr:sugar-binding domain-containing protein [Mariniblastus fucicola]QEG23408.1 Beta-galactosidase [Mariniblastus fucicola]
MKSRIVELVLAVIALSWLPLILAASEPVDPIDLAGRWSVKLDPDDRGEQEQWFDGFTGTEIELPGICTEAGLGKPLDAEIVRLPKAYQHLHQRRSYLGAAWYQREFELPETFTDRDATLTLERVLWESKVWVNGVCLGTQSSLSTAHQFSAANVLRAGKNQIVVRVDNREQVPMGTLSHAYTEETQTIWNGLIGKIQLSAKPSVSIERLSVTPTPVGNAIRVSVEVDNRTGETVSLPLSVKVRSTQSSKSETQIDLSREIPAGRQTVNVEVPAKDLQLWSEFSPHLYEVVCELDAQQVAVTTGFRKLAVEDSQILINGRRSFMRGTLDCCIFPKTGYPPTDVESWTRQFKVAKSYGLNHVRFHSWCPPEAAFAAADRLGIYLQVELPCWTNQMGQDPQVNRFFQTEGERIFHSYSHHPSFMFFSLGNELKGDFKLMDQMLSGFRTKAEHILMTSTSFSFSRRGRVPGPQDQFFVSQRTESGWVRGQGFFNQNAPETVGDFNAGVSPVSQPLISHEIGQYSVFPNLEEIGKYDGNLRPLALEAIQANLESQGRVSDAKLATHNSGKLALTLYKEEIERAIRTPGQDGFQLLSLQDFSGQGTATVGILDAFWDSKGLVEPETFRDFCSVSVPLLRLEKRSFTASETLRAKVQVGHFGAKPMQDTDWMCIIKRQDETLFQKQWSGVDIAIGNAIDIGQIEFALGKITRPSQLEISVLCPERDLENRWSVWVYPGERERVQEVKVFNQLGSEMLQALERGESVLLLPQRESIRHPIDGRFVPVFWSPLHFPKQSPTHGTIIKNDHPVFDRFPTDSHTNWQWWELLSESTSVDMTEVAQGRSLPIMRFIDKFNRNALPAILWEAKIGRGKLFVCTLDIEKDLDRRPVAAALRNAIHNYMNGDAFDPADEITKSQLEVLFK